MEYRNRGGTAIVFYQPHGVVDLLLVAKRKTRGRTKTTNFTLTISVKAMVNDVLIIVMLNVPQPRRGWRAAVQTIQLHFGPMTACLVHRVTRCRGYRGALVRLSYPTFWLRNLSSIK